MSRIVAAQVRATPVHPRSLFFQALLERDVQKSKNEAGRMQRSIVMSVTSVRQLVSDARGGRAGGRRRTARVVLQQRRSDVERQARGVCTGFRAGFCAEVPPIRVDAGFARSAGRSARAGAGAGDKDGVPGLPIDAQEVAGPMPGL
jgi:hypothetical protein